MKENFYVELGDKKSLVKDISTKFKEMWKSEGKRVKEIESLDLYYKPEEGFCYYVINGETKGKFIV